MLCWFPPVLLLWSMPEQLIRFLTCEPIYIYCNSIIVLLLWSMPELLIRFMTCEPIYIYTVALLLFCFCGACLSYLLDSWLVSLLYEYIYCITLLYYCNASVTQLLASSDEPLSTGLLIHLIYFMNDLFKLCYNLTKLWYQKY